MSSINYKPRPLAHVERGASNNPNIGSSDFSNDSIAAYSHALQWQLTGKKIHADKAIEILNAWSATLESVSGHDARLLIGMAGIGFCNAAELVRHSDSDWEVKDQDRFEKMLREIFYPIIEDFYPSANGNWDASMIQTMLAMGVFLDDREMFDRAVNYFLRGEGNGAIENYFNTFGECQESGRDQAHTQMGVGFLGAACEIAWKQGVDLYSAADNRLALGFEYTAKYNLGHDVRYEPYESFEGRYHYKKLSSSARGRFAPIYERIAHHYHDRIGLEMPYSREVARKLRPEGMSTTHMPWGSLLFHRLPTGLNPIEVDSEDEVEPAEAEDAPVILGHGKGRFKVGALIAKDDFENLDNWTVQIQQRSGFPPSNVEARENSLDCLVPGRGCTAWFKQKLPTRVTISYDVLCPTPDPAIKGVQPRDINNFWMASDPLDPDKGLFDSTRYLGKFNSYNKLLGYYASTGGGGAVANRTTRMRRYPREVDGKPTEHLALKDKDGKPGYLITPDKVMSIQLVAYDDVVQYIVDGKLIYQIAGGDRVQVESRDSEGAKKLQDAVYDLQRFPVYREGYFGFRMVGTHHIYTNFQVHELEPDDREDTQAAGKKSTSPKKKAVAYEASVPEPTLTKVRYGDHSRNHLDFWKASSETPTPLVFVIHGGGWNGGTKEQIHKYVDTAALLEAGISVAAINYRLIKHSQDFEPPVKGPLLDCARALQFVRSKADQWNIDKERIGAAGGSAGACSSLWLAWHDDLADPKSDDAIAHESTRLTCVAVTRPQTTLDPKQMKQWIPNSKYGAHAFGINGFSEFLAQRDSILPTIKEYSPYSLLDASDAPAYMFFKIKPDVGKKQKDPTHSANFGVKIQERCKEVGVACEIVYPDAPDVSHETTTEYLLAMLKDS